MPRISQKNKYIVQAMLHDNKSPAEISAMTGISEKSVENYINGELDKLHSTVVTVQTEKIVDAAKIQEQIDKEFTKELLKPEKAPQEPPPPQKPPKLPEGFSKRVFGLKPNDQRTTHEDGYAIMTPAASAAGDNFNKHMPKGISRTARNNLYRADTGEKVGE